MITYRTSLIIIFYIFSYKHLPVEDFLLLTSGLVTGNLHTTIAETNQNNFNIIKQKTVSSYKHIIILKTIFIVNLKNK